MASLTFNEIPEIEIIRFLVNMTEKQFDQIRFTKDEMGRYRRFEATPQTVVTDDAQRDEIKRNHLNLISVGDFTTVLTKTNSKKLLDYILGHLIYNHPSQKFASRKNKYIEYFRKMNGVDIAQIGFAEYKYHTTGSFSYEPSVSTNILMLNHFNIVNVDDFDTILDPKNSKKVKDYLACVFLLRGDSDSGVVTSKVEEAAEVRVVQPDIPEAIPVVGYSDKKKKNNECLIL